MSESVVALVLWLGFWSLMGLFALLAWLYTIEKACGKKVDDKEA